MDGREIIGSLGVIKVMIDTYKALRDLRAKNARDPSLMPVYRLSSRKCTITPALSPPGVPRE